MGTYMAGLLGGMAESVGQLMLEDRREQLRQQNKQIDMIGKLLETGQTDVLQYFDPKVLKNAGFDEKMMSGLMGADSLMKQEKQAKIAGIQAQTQFHQAKAKEAEKTTAILDTLSPEERKIAAVPGLGTMATAKLNIESNEKIAQASQNLRASEQAQQWKIHIDNLQQQQAALAQQGATQQQRLALDTQIADANQKMADARLKEMQQQHEDTKTYHTDQLAALKENRIESRKQTAAAAAAKRSETAYKDAMNYLTKMGGKNEKTGESIPFTDEKTAKTVQLNLQGFYDQQYLADQEFAKHTDTEAPKRLIVKMEPTQNWASKATGGFLGNTAYSLYTEREGSVTQPTETAPAAQKKTPYFEKLLLPDGAAVPTDSSSSSSDVVGYLQSGRPVVKNPNGSVSTHKVTTIEIDGKTYNVPTMYGGKTVSPDEAERIIKSNNMVDPDTGQKLVGYGSRKEADDAYSKEHQAIDKEASSVAAKKTTNQSVPQFEIPKDRVAVARIRNALDLARGDAKERPGSAIRTLVNSGMSREVAEHIVKNDLFETALQAIETETAMRQKGGRK